MAILNDKTLASVAAVLATEVGWGGELCPSQILHSLVRHKLCHTQGISCETRIARGSRL